MGKFVEYPVKHLISFDAVETSPTSASQMTVKEMISEVANYRRRWDTATKDGTYDQGVVQKVEEQFLVNFIFRSNLEEGHGLRTLDETRSFLGRIFSRRDFPRPLSLEEQETLNMRNAYETLLAKIKREELDRDYGLLEASLLKEIHRVILQDIPLSKGLTKPGEMSNKPRMTEFRGEIYYYANPEDMESAVVNLLDKYNFLFDTCTKDGLTNFEDLCDFFKTCAWILLELLDLHPFSDGNGRLCRILCSYSLSKLNPFPTPIYSVWTDSPNDAYIEALVEGRNSPGRHPCALTTMIVQCSYYQWKNFFEALDKETASTCRTIARKNEHVLKKTVHVLQNVCHQVMQLFPVQKTSRLCPN